MKIDEDVADLLFRALFCLIFIGLGSEHLFSDDLIRTLMPAWVPFPSLVSKLCGVWLVGWGCLILIGWHVRMAALGLGAFLVIVTPLVHLPGIFIVPQTIAPEYHWMWQILQRSNLVKNLCLLGVCFHLLYHEPGKYSVEAYLKRR